MKIDKTTGIALLGIGAVALYALTRKQEPDDLGVFPEAWGGGSATPPTPGVTPIINFPEIPPYVEQRPQEWLFYPQLSYPEQDSGTHKKETVPPSTSASTYTTGDPIHQAVGPNAGFGGGGAGGRGGEPTAGIGDVLKTLISPLNLFMSATPFGVVAAAPQAGLALANTALAKKDDKVSAEKSAFETATGSAASVAAGSSGSGTGSSKKVVSAPSEDVSEFFTAGRNYGSATVIGRSSAGTVYQHSGGARSVVSQGQIVASSSRALDAADVARLPKKIRDALGY